MSRVDLHLHSTASDGRFSPAEVVRKSVQAGLAVIALTDHDTVDGIPLAVETAIAFPGFKMIPGVEINTDVPTGEAHILGYFIDYAHPELEAGLVRMRHSRQERAQQMIARLNKLGLTIKWERVREIASTDAIGRPHVAQALLEKGYVSSIKEAFTKYIGWGGLAYVERAKMAPVEAVELIIRAKGLPVLAHPFTISNPEAMVGELKDKGLVGIEAYYGSHTTDQINRLVNLAAKHGLIATGGSDYHGLDDSTETPIGGAPVPLQAAEQLIARAAKSGRHLTRPQPRRDGDH